MKFRFSFAFVLLLSFFAATMTHANTTNFNTYGLKGDASSLQDVTNYEPSKKITLGNHINVPLTKTWTINFSNIATAKNVTAVVAIYNDQLIPLTISGLNSKQLKVKATHQFPANADIELRAYLKNGKWYTVNFTTANQVRDVTKTNNSTTAKQAIPLYLNERIKGAFHGEEDYYSFTLTKPGTLTIPQTPELELIGHQVYKVMPDGSLQNIEPYVYTQANYAVELTAGSYMLIVYNSTGDDNFTYPLQLVFDENEGPSDPNDQSFNDAVPLQLAQPITTTLNMQQADGTLDTKDYYALTVTQDGFVHFTYDVAGYDYVTLKLYNAHQQLLEAKRVSNGWSMLKQLPKGTYYIELANAEGPIKYTLEFAATSPIDMSNDVESRLAVLKQKWQALKPKSPDITKIYNASYTSPYNPGTVDEIALQDSLNYTNMVRFTAGLPANFVMTDYLNEIAQAGSLISYVNDELSHHATKPADMTEELFDKGRNGLYTNIASNYFKLYSTVQGYMDDLGHDNSLTVGHRLAILNPSSTTVGFGIAHEEDKLDLSRSAASYSAMRIMDGSYSDILFEPIAWPAKTVMPLQFAEEKASWSITFSSAHYNLQVEDIQVTLMRNGGQALQLNAQNTEYFNVRSYGEESTVLIFKPEHLTPFEEGDHFKVEVTGLQDAQGKPTSYTYETTFLSIE
ncbi:MAG: CAP domain-containing protein [Lysinibacillus sp.]